MEQPRILLPNVYMLAAALPLLATISFADIPAGPLLPANPVRPATKRERPQAELDGQAPPREGTPQCESDLVCTKTNEIGMPIAYTGPSSLDADGNDLRSEFRFGIDGGAEALIAAKEAHAAARVEKARWDALSIDARRAAGRDVLPWPGAASVEPPTLTTNGLNGQNAPIYDRDGGFYGPAKYRASTSANSFGRLDSGDPPGISYASFKTRAEAAEAWQGVAAARQRDRDAELGRGTVREGAPDRLLSQQRSSDYAKDTSVLEAQRLAGAMGIKTRPSGHLHDGKHGPWSAQAFATFATWHNQYELHHSPDAPALPTNGQLTQRMLDAMRAAAQDPEKRHAVGLAARKSAPGKIDSLEATDPQLASAVEMARMLKSGITDEQLGQMVKEWIAQNPGLIDEHLKGLTNKQIKDFLKTMPKSQLQEMARQGIQQMPESQLRKMALQHVDKEVPFIFRGIARFFVGNMSAETIRSKAIERASAEMVIQNPELIRKHLSAGRISAELRRMPDAAIGKKIKSLDDKMMGTIIARALSMPGFADTMPARLAPLPAAPAARVAAPQAESQKTAARTVPLAPASADESKALSPRASPKSPEIRTATAAPRLSPPQTPSAATPARPTAGVRPIVLPIRHTPAEAPPASPEPAIAIPASPPAQPANQFEKYLQMEPDDLVKAVEGMSSESLVATLSEVPDSTLKALREKFEKMDMTTKTKLYGQLAWAVYQKGRWDLMKQLRAAYIGRTETPKTQIQTVAQAQ